MFIFDAWNLCVGTTIILDKERVAALHAVCKDTYRKNRKSESRTDLLVKTLLLK